MGARLLSSFAPTTFEDSAGALILPSVTA
jgi:hypothetical protein